MKTQREKRAESLQKQNKMIWKHLRIEQAVKKYGFPEVKQALNKWVNYQRENAKLLKEKRTLEEKLSAIEKKL